MDGWATTVIGLGAELAQLLVAGRDVDCPQVMGVVAVWWVSPSQPAAAFAIMTVEVWRVGPSQPAASFAIVTGWSGGNAQLDGDGAGTAAGAVDGGTSGGALYQPSRGTRSHDPGRWVSIDGRPQFPQDEALALVCVAETGISTELDVLTSPLVSVAVVIGTVALSVGGSVGTELSLAALLGAGAGAGVGVFATKAVVVLEKSHALARLPHERMLPGAAHAERVMPLMVGTGTDCRAIVRVSDDAVSERGGMVMDLRAGVRGRGRSCEQTSSSIGFSPQESG